MKRAGTAADLLSQQDVGSLFPAERCGGLQQINQVQDLGRLLSTRQRTVTLAGRGRLVIPEGFREFLGVEPGGELLVVGAAVCVELWNPVAWGDFITAEMPAFRQRIDELTA